MKAMFTGIVEEKGEVKRIEHTKNLCSITIQARKILKKIKRGDSVAVEGVCLTATDIRKNFLTFDIMRETLLKTTLGALKVHSKVNLERALTAHSRISGHLVTGHVDGLGRIREIVGKKNYAELKVAFPKGIRSLIVPKGSICIDGVSLTVGRIGHGWFSIYLIPFTKRVTTLGMKRKGDLVNIETDIVAKYLFKKKW